MLKYGCCHCFNLEAEIIREGGKTSNRQYWSKPCVDPPPVFSGVNPNWRRFWLLDHSPNWTRVKEKIENVCWLSNWSFIVMLAKAKRQQRAKLAMTMTMQWVTVFAWFALLLLHVPVSHWQWGTIQKVIVGYVSLCVRLEGQSNTIWSCGGTQRHHIAWRSMIWVHLSKTGNWIVGWVGFCIYCVYKQTIQGYYWVACWLL